MAPRSTAHNHDVLIKAQSLNPYFPGANGIVYIYEELLLLPFRGLCQPEYLPRERNRRPLSFEGQLAPARGAPLLAHETGECTAIAKCLGATFLGG
jgi:hypothetical protein